MRFPADVPVLTDGVVTLRAHTPADVPAATEMCQDPEMQRWTTVPVPYVRHHAEHFLTERIPAGWRDGGYWGWAIEYDGRFAGTIDLRGGEGSVSDVGFAAAPWARGNGVTTRATRLVVEHAFERFGWDRVTWRAFVGNWASRRVAWKCGFRHLVTVRASGLARGVVHDSWVASLGRDDDRTPANQWWTAPVLDGDGIRLRPFRSTDARRTVEACTDEQSQHWLSGLPSPYLLTDADGFIAGRAEQQAIGEGVAWVVADPDTDELLANVSIFRMNGMDPTSGEIGYWAHPQARRRGRVTAAVGLVIRHAFTPVEQGGLGRRRLTLFAAEGNTASKKIALANGFTPVGTGRAADRCRDGSFRDLHAFDLLVTD